MTEHVRHWRYIFCTWTRRIRFHCLQRTYVSLMLNFLSSLAVTAFFLAILTFTEYNAMNILRSNEFCHFVAAKYEASILLIALLFRPIVHICYRIRSIIVQRICIRDILLSHVTQCLLVLRYCAFFGTFIECSSKTKWQVSSYVSRKYCSYALNYCMYYTSLRLMGVTLIWRFHCHLAIATAYFKRTPLPMAFLLMTAPHFITLYQYYGHNTVTSFAKSSLIVYCSRNFPGSPPRTQCTVLNLCNLYRLWISHH